MTRLRAVFFDVGETILDETREWGTWADWLGVPRHTFSAVFGAVLARGGDFRETFQHFRPGFDLAAERQGRIDAGLPEAITEESLYPDARPCLAALREQGLLIGLAGNQPARVEALLHRLDFPVDVVGTSDGWGVEKPLPEFFDRVAAEAGCPAEAVLYVGDRLDNDIRPAQAAGMRTALIRRGRGPTSSKTPRRPSAACSGSTRWRSCRRSWLSTTCEYVSGRCPCGDVGSGGRRGRGCRMRWSTIRGEGGP